MWELQRRELLVVHARINDSHLFKFLNVTLNLLGDCSSNRQFHQSVSFDSKLANTSLNQADVLHTLDYWREDGETWSVLYKKRIDALT